jgi:predicted TIM-barrel enzyme
VGNARCFERIVYLAERITERGVARMHHDRESVLKRFREEIKRGRTLFMASCGSGIVAKFLERAGCDMAGVYNAVKLRSYGAGSMTGMWPVSDANGLMFEYASREIMPVVREMPVMGGVNANDPTRDIPRFLEELLRIGIVGVNNFPTVGLIDGNFRNVLEQTGITYDNEIQMMKTAKAMGMVTVSYAFNVSETERIVGESAPDVLIFHAGTTIGGSIGYNHPDTVEETARRTQEVYNVARKLKPDIILLTHGAALSDPESGQRILELTDGHGIQTGSATERIPLEEAVLNVASAFKNLRRGIG